MSTCRAAASLHRRFTPTRDVLCIDMRVIRGLSGMEPGVRARFARLLRLFTGGVTEGELRAKAPRPRPGTLAPDPPPPPRLLLLLLSDRSASGAARVGLTHPVTPSSPSCIPAPASIHPPPSWLLLPFIGYLTLFLLTLLSLYLSWLGLPP